MESSGKKKKLITSNYIFILYIKVESFSTFCVCTSKHHPFLPKFRSPCQVLMFYYLCLNYVSQQQFFLMMLYQQLSVTFFFFSINNVLLKYNPRNGTHVFETENYTFWIPQVCLEVTLLHVPETSLLVSISSEIDYYPIFWICGHVLTQNWQPC